METQKNIISLVSYQILPADTGGQRGIAFFNKYLGLISNLICISVKSNNEKLAEHYQLRKILSDNRLRYINPFYFFQIRKVIKKENSEWLILEHPYYGWLAWLLKKFTKVKLAVHTHNIEHERFRSVGKKWWKLLRFYEKWTFSFADRVFCISAEDRQYMIDNMHIDADKCIVIPYGIVRDSPPENKNEVKTAVCRELNLDTDTHLLFFNGALHYKPNADALDVILNEINPLLLKHSLKYKILIAGKNLPERFDQLRKWTDKNVVFLGFVEDIDRYTLASDILLNTVTSGGGIKTKVVEALGMSTTVISTISGAAGINPEITKQKLIITDDYDWHVFSKKVIEATSTPVHHTPPEFYREFFWGHISQRVIQSLSD